MLLSFEVDFKLGVICVVHLREKSPRKVVNSSKPEYIRRTRVAYQDGSFAVAGEVGADHPDLKGQAVEGAGLFPGVGVAPAEHLCVVPPQVEQRPRPH